MIIVKNTPSHPDHSVDSPDLWVNNVRLIMDRSKKRYPAGIRIPAASTGDYQPPIVEGIPYRADGQPGLLCAGWVARNRALTAKREASSFSGDTLSGGDS